MTSTKNDITFKTPSQISSEHVNHMLQEIRSAMNSIHQKNPAVISFEELYRYTYVLVQQHRGDTLYQEIEKSLKENLQSQLVILLKTNEHDFLFSLNQLWNDYKVSSYLIKEILLYFDRTYIVRKEKLQIHELSLQIFRSNIIQNPQICHRIQNCLLSLITCDREGSLIDKCLFRSITNLLTDLGVGVYMDNFEAQYLLESRTYYSALSQKYLTDSRTSFNEYMRIVRRKFDDEEERVSSYLDRRTHSKIKSILEKELLENHLQTISQMKNGIMHLLENKKIEDLNIVYTLFSRIPQAQSFLLHNLKTYIETKGKSVMLDPETKNDAILFISSFLEIKEEIEIISIKSLSNDKVCKQTIQKSFQYILNLEPRLPEYLSSYIDNGIKHQWKQKSDLEIDSILSNVLIVFRCLQERDVFERYYENHLSRRLLSDRSSVDDEIESSLLEKLKIECGSQFTVKLEGMFKDLKISNEISKTFRTETSDSSNFEFSCYILTKGTWPFSSNLVTPLPTPLKEISSRFEEFYNKLHSGRVLTWQTHLGSGEIRGKFSSYTYEFIASTIQIIILLLFNEKNSFSFQELLSRTQVPHDILERQIRGLSNTKNLILLKSPVSKNVAETDIFILNPQFTSKTIKVKVLVSAIEKDLEIQRKETKFKVDEDRKYEIEAAIVRVMKSRQQLHHNTLLVEVINCLQKRFVPNTACIKQRIESLIERDFIMRNPFNLQEYQYMS